MFTLRMKKHKTITYYIFLFIFVFQINAQVTKPQEVTSQKELSNALNFIEKIHNGKLNILDYYKNSSEYLIYLKETLKWSELNANTSDIIKIKHQILSLYITSNNIFEIIIWSNELLKYKEILDSKTVRDIYYILKSTYRNSGQFQELLLMLPDYHKYSKKYGYVTIDEKNYDCEMGFIYYNLKNFNKAIEAYKKCLNDNEIKKNYLTRSNYLNNIGQSFFKLHNKDSSFYYHKKAINAIENQSKITEYDKHFLNVIKSNIASINLNESNLNKILKVFLNELYSGKKFNENNIIVNSYFKIASLYYKSQKPTIVYHYLDSLKEVLKNYNNSNLYKKMIDLRGKTLLLEGKVAESSKIFEKYRLFSDSLEIEKIRKETLSGVIKHETDQRTKELEEVRFKNKLARKTLLFQWIIIGLLIVLLLIFIYFLWKIRKNNSTIKSQKEILSNALNEKEILLKEIHHRVKNNLQVISGLLFIQSRKKEKSSVEIVLEESQKQIESMSLIHEMLYNKENLSKIPLEEYISQLSKNLLSAYSKKDIKLNIQTNNIDLHIDFANPIGLIINELITNSLKHGFKNKNSGIIKIVFSKLDNQIQFEYSDNGVGLISGKNIIKSNFGNRLIKVLAEEIKASYIVKSDSGLTYIFNFKI